jgi:hypothetical protein
MAKKANHLLIYTGGIPTEPEVNSLFEEIGVPEIGQVITYIEVERIIGATRKQSRWGSVVTAWRKRLERQHNILLKCPGDHTFRAMTAEERIADGIQRIKQGMKQAIRGAYIISTTNLELVDEDHRKAADHALRTEAAMKFAFMTEARKFELPDTSVSSNGN